MTGIDNDTHSSANINNLDACHSSSSSKTTPTVQEQPQPNRDEYERLFGADELLDKQPTTTRRELWSYYLYYNVECMCSCCFVDG